MKIKNTFIVFSLLTGLFLTSCVTDYGNYEYQEPDVVLPVSISGIKDTSIIKGGYLVLEPDVTIAGDQSNYTYSWYVMPATVAGTIPTKTVLSNTKNLNKQITLAVGSYLLNFAVIDSVRDIYVRNEVTLTVKATEVGSGWFVLKDIDNETDFDYINSNGDIYPDVLLTLAEPAGNRLTGKAIKIEYQSGRYFHQVTDENGKLTTLTNKKVYHILSDEDIKVFNAETLELFKNQQDVFYTPTVCRPQNIVYTRSSNLFLINDSKALAIYGMMANFGKLSPKVGFYSFHKDLLTDYSYGNAMGFDMDNRTFYHAEAFSPDLSLFRTGQISTTNMDATLLNLLSAPGTGFLYFSNPKMFAVMKNVDKEEYYLATLNYRGSNAYPIAVSESDPDRVAFDTIPAGSKFPTAPVKTAPFSGNFVYFAEGNKLSVYRNAPGLAVRESLLKEFPEDETISYIAHIYKTGSFNCLAVLTNGGAGWKLYVFNVIGLGNPEFEDTPVFVRQGTGNARFVMYRP
jgi:hypothetical protein